MSVTRTRSRRVALRVVLFVALLALLESIGALVLHLAPNVAKTRELLRGRLEIETEVNSTSQAYLLYIPTPGFVANGMVQVNSDGYRGERVPVNRRPNSLRVLFLGGSTTYGEGVESPDDSFPAQVGRMLRADPEFAGRDVEIVNAGLRWGTSAELLTHYLLKFRYYRPDLVVLNPGGNDPSAYETPNYQPDYSHWRTPPDTLRPLRGGARWLLESRLLSAVIVLAFFPDVPVGTRFVHRDEVTPAHWFTPATPKQLELRELAFYNNISSAVREMQQDGASVFLLSYQGNPFDAEQAGWRKYYDYEEKVLATIGRELHVDFAPLPLERFPRERWVDPSHLDREGELRKAAFVHERVVPILRHRLADPPPKPSAPRSDVVPPLPLRR